MSTTALPIDELYELAGALVDEAIGEAAFARLQTLLDADDRARRFFVRYVDLHATLRVGPARFAARSEAVSDDPTSSLDTFDQLLREATRSASNDLLETKAANEQRARAKRSPVLGFLGSWLKSPTAIRNLVILLACSLGIFATWAYWPAAQVKSNSQSVAMLTAASDCRWSGKTPQLNARLARGEWQLQSGIAQLTLINGVDVYLEGPCQVELGNEQTFALHEGRLLARVPRRAVGFTVQTRDAQVIDRGTEFVVEAHDGLGTNVAVTEGIVDVVATGASPLRLAAGQATSVRGQATPVVAAATEAAWVSHVASLPDLMRAKFKGSPMIHAQPNTPGNQGDYVGAMGIDFEITQPMTVQALGVFDHASDGVVGDAKLTVQLWARDTHGTGDTADDTGEMDLAELTFTATKPGVLGHGYRFKPLSQPLTLEPGSYSIVAYGFDAANPSFSPALAGAANPQALVVNTQHDALKVTTSRWQQPAKPGLFPDQPAPQQLLPFGAGSLILSSEVSH